MKYFVCCILMPILVSCASITTSESNLSDSVIRDKLIGSWVCDVRDTLCSPGVSTYNKDGTLDYVAYGSEKCEKIETKVKATWRIEKGKLIIIVQKSEGLLQFSPGYIVVDNVLEISDSSKVLVGEDGHRQLRLRGNKCVHGTQI